MLASEFVPGDIIVVDVSGEVFTFGKGGGRE
jgi:hypothetical protein